MHVVVTGASSGIGEAIVREWARAGASITMVARRTDLLEKLARDLPTPAHVIGADLSDTENCESVLKSAVKAFGPIDVLVNNAGMQIVASLGATDLEKAESLLRLNLHTPMRLAAAVLPNMLAQGSGTIVNIASLAALSPVPAMTYYSASKGGLAAASEALRTELRGSGVRVLTVYPGPVTTPMAEAAYEVYEEAGAGKRARQMPTGNTKALAQRIVTAVKKGKQRVIYPRVYTLARMFPGTTSRLVDRFSPSL